MPRVYIETLKDNAISIDLQRKMYQDSPCEQVITLDSDHSPFLSQPDKLAVHLNHIAINEVIIPKQKVF